MYTVVQLLRLVTDGSRNLRIRQQTQVNDALKLATISLLDPSLSVIKSYLSTKIYLYNHA